ncbi:hypothetical protein PAMP_012558 [Pampus punctatissimus]
MCVVHVVTDRAQVEDTARLDPASRWQSGRIGLGRTCVVLVQSYKGAEEDHGYLMEEATWGEQEHYLIKSMSQNHQGAWIWSEAATRTGLLHFFWRK